MNRRSFVQMASVGALYAQASHAEGYRVALIGDTGHGNYGHDWDIAWKSVPNTRVVAVADPDNTGRQRAMARSGAAQGYGDYREMLAKEKPDIVTICTRWPEHRLAMLTAAAEVKAHVLTEKPFARTLEEADAMVAVAERHGIQVQVGHPYRVMPDTLLVHQMLRTGELGTLMEIRARGKEDRRAGGEDLMVLGTHYLDLMRDFAGDPAWVFADVTERGRPARTGHAASEPVGLIAGDDVAAIFGFGNRVHGYLASKASDVQTGKRFGFNLYCSKAAAFLPSGGTARLLRNADWVGGDPSQWQTLAAPPAKTAGAREESLLLAADLATAIAKNRQPACSARDGRWTIEMVTGIYQSALSGKPVPFPLSDRHSPLRET